MIRDTSLAALRSLDVTASQAKILAAFRLQDELTRQDLVRLTGCPINSVCGRTRELLDAGLLEELPPRDGRHVLRLRGEAGAAWKADTHETAGRIQPGCESMARVSSEGRQVGVASDRQPSPTYAAAQMTCDQKPQSSSSGLASAAPVYVKPTERQVIANAADDSSGDVTAGAAHPTPRGSSYVPYKREGRPAMPRERALQILSRKDVRLIPDFVLDECRAVVAGATWWRG